ncbi:hypothetical protein G7046_g7205 [Stylonectria norvegica]|nr:hypothetical protein G7046_g7205 [Stylonectria norvegica]
MGDYYHHFLSSMSGAGMNPGTPDEMYQQAISGLPMSMPSMPMTGSYQQLGYFTGFPEPVTFNASNSQKASQDAIWLFHVQEQKSQVRRDPASCRKGGRECVYPDPPASKGSSGTGSKSKDSASSTQQGSPSSSNGEEDDELEQDAKLETIHDEEEPDEESQASYMPTTSRRPSTTVSSFQQSGGGQHSETASGEVTKSSSPSASTATTNSLTTAAQTSSELPHSVQGKADWSHLPSEFQTCLSHFVENMTHYHYCLPSDADDFFKTILPGVALQHEPLLNALVGFSAYHLTLKNPDGKLQDFLQYYNRSVTLLLGLLKRKEKHNVATLLTILQLATIEEYLGDWVNLMGHQKAAFEILTKMFTPQSVMQTPLGRMCLSWYSRFDNFVALMGGFPTDLPRAWFVEMLEFNKAQTLGPTDVLRWRIDECRGQIPTDQFITEHDILTKRLIDWKRTLDTDLAAPQYLVQDLPRTRPADPDDIVDPFSPGILYDFPYFTATLLSAEWNSIMIMHRCQSSGMRPDILFGELRKHAYATCQYFETLEYWPSTPKGVLILIQACIAIAALFLPQDSRHHMWFRRKFALLEAKGYIHPITLRSKMAEMFQEPSCARWWLPNDEGFSPVLQSIRNFADERNAAAVTAQQENLREVRHIFAKMELNDPRSGSSGQ